MNERHLTYEAQKRELIVIPDMHVASNNNPLFENDHPLSVRDKSMWNQYFLDNKLWQEIEKDIRRTRTEMEFFCDAFDKSQRWNKE